MNTNTPRPFSITFLGTGTSQGVPVIGCQCPVCQSTDPRDRRLRTSIFLEFEQQKLLIDIGPDFRMQMLQNGFTDVDAILLTHEHNDHIIGLDDVRPINFRQQRNMPVYAQERVCRELKTRFRYIFQENPYPGIPMIELIPIEEQAVLQLGDIAVQPVPVRHGALPILGFRFGNFAYLTDIKSLAPSSFDLLDGIEYVVVGALRREPHHSHFTLLEALDFIAALDPKGAWLTHFSHHMGLHAAVEDELPAGVRVAYDGLKLEIGKIL